MKKFVMMLVLLPTIALAEVEEVIVVGANVSFGYSDPAYHNSSIEAIESTKVYTPGGPGGFTAVGRNGTDSKHTTVYRNGIPVNDPSAGWYDFGIDLPTFQDYKVISGPNSVLFGSSSMAGTILMEDTFEKHVFYKGGDTQQMISGGNGWFQVARFKGSMGSVKNTNDETDWYENTTLKTKSNYFGFDFTMVSQDYSYDYDDCLPSTIEYNDCNQSGYKTDISARNDWLTLGYSLSSARHNTGWGAKSSRIYVDSKYKYKKFLVGVTGQEEEYDSYFRSPIPNRYKDSRVGVYFNWNGDKLGLGYRFEDDVHIGRVGFSSGDWNLSLANSFRSPNLYERYGDDWVSGNPDLNAEKGVGAEIHWKGISVWHYEFSDGIDFDLANYQYVNTGSYETSGIKFRRSFNSLSVMVGYTDTDKPQKARYKTRISYDNNYGKFDYMVAYIGEFDRGFDYIGRPIDNISTVDIHLGYYLGPRYRMGVQIRDIFNKKFEILPEYGAGGRQILVSFDLSM